MKEERKVVSVKDFDMNLWRQAKASAALCGQTMTEWAEDAIRDHIEKTKRQELFKSPTSYKD